MTSKNDRSIVGRTYYTLLASVPNPEYDKRQQYGLGSIACWPEGTLVVRKTMVGRESSEISSPSGGKHYLSGSFHYLDEALWQKMVSQNLLKPMEWDAITLSQAAAVEVTEETYLCLDAVRQLIDEGKLSAADVRRAYQRWHDAHPSE